MMKTDMTVALTDDFGMSAVRWRLRAQQMKSFIGGDRKLYLSKFQTAGISDADADGEDGSRDFLAAGAKGNDQSGLSPGHHRFSNMFEVLFWRRSNPVWRTRSVDGVASGNRHSAGMNAKSRSGGHHFTSNRSASFGVTASLWSVKARNRKAVQRTRRERVAMVFVIIS